MARSSTRSPTRSTRRAAPRYERYRANITTGGLHYGEVVEIDASRPEWQVYIERGWLSPAPPFDVDVSHVEAAASAVRSSTSAQTATAEAKTWGSPFGSRSPTSSTSGRPSTSDDDDSGDGGDDG
jgi:hypothetical protein